MSDISSPSLIKSDEELGSCPLIHYVTDIINIKYKVPREDVKACQRPIDVNSPKIKIWVICHFFRASVRLPKFK